MDNLIEFKKKLQIVRHSFLLGTMRDDSSLSKLRGNRDLLEELIKTIEKPLYDEFYRNHINTKETPYMIWPRETLVSHPIIPPIKTIVFPRPKDININMMPIRLGRGFGSVLPEFCQQYVDFIWEYAKSMSWYFTKEGYTKPRIGYLTIQEGWVPVGKPQRRPGLHIERPGVIKCGGIWHGPDTPTCHRIAWGMGSIGEDGMPEEGIFMASTVDNSCAIWDGLIENPEEVTDKHGGIEHMRHLLGKPRMLKANEMCWFTDRTPHESLPIQAPKNDPKATHVYRQFFRLVVGPISVWYSKHNTPNPLGIQPDAPISDEDKFLD